MGFFSWCCPVCGLSIIAPEQRDEAIAWQNECVLIEKDGTLITGTYDGHGRIEGHHGIYQIGGLEASLYHKACWEYAGSPRQYVRSSNAEDQGYFFDIRSVKLRQIYQEEI